jgi:hypothetical protein
MSKTNLQKILSIAGQPGLFRFVAQAKAGVVAESIVNGKRNMFGMNARLTSLADISIYTVEEEMPLIKVLEKMKEHLGQDNAPEAKSKPEILKSFFDNVIPNYDQDRFYVSHMKKVVEWYNLLKQHESLDFEYPEQESAEGDSTANQTQSE